MSDDETWEADFERIPGSAQSDSFEPIPEHPLSSAFLAFEERLAAQDESAAECRAAQVLASAAADSADLTGREPTAVVGLLMRIADALDVVGDELERGRRQCEDLAGEHEQTKAELEVLRRQYEDFVQGKGTA
jgi:hypothetical protein